MKVTAGLAVIGLAVAGSTPLDAQRVRFKLDAVGLTYQEVNAGRDAVGGGFGGGLEFRVGRFRLDARGYATRVTPDGDRPDYDMAQVDVRVAYMLTEFLALEVGGGRRYVTPDFRAPGVGLFRLGVLSENRLHRLASVWVRGAYIADPRFTTGGSADLAFEFGLGAGINSSGGRFRVHAEYEFQRIDRVVEQVDVPMQLSVGRLGLALGF